MGITPYPFPVQEKPFDKSIMQWKVYHTPLISLSLCLARIYYVHSTTLDMSHVCIHPGHDNYLISNGMCRESIDIAYQCIAKEVGKPPTAKNSTIVIVANKQLFANYLLKSPIPRMKNHLKEASLELVMDKFQILVSPNCRKFMVGSKRFIRSSIGTMDSIMALNDHSRFIFVHGGCFPSKSNDKVFVFKMFINMPDSRVNLVNRM